MTRVQASDSNAYDVLGVSPNASAEEIDAAFHQLIEGGGYRVGVPLRGQWLRAHQIKEAYAALGDPIKRRAYDESLKGGSERPLWPATADNDPAEASLVRPLSDWQPPPEPTLKTIPDALGSGDGAQELVPAGPIEPANDEPANDEIVPDDDQTATSPEDDASRNGVQDSSAKLWGSAAAATLAIGALFYFTWPSGQQQLPTSEMAGQPPAGAQQMNSGAPTTGRLANLPPAIETGGSFGEAKAAGDTSPGADGLTVSVDIPGATETVAPGAAPAEVAANQAQTGPGAAAASGGNVASATAPAPAPSSSGQTSTAAEVAAASTAPASVSTGAEAPTSEAVRPRAGEVRSPAQLIGGGPTGVDNPRGRHVGTVVVQFTVQADGRVSNCGPVRSSGKADLDAMTCRLVEERMRFKPALDAQGNPVASTAHARYEWGRRRRHPSLLSWIFR